MCDGNRRILIIDDNELIHDDFRRVLQWRTDETGELDQLVLALFGDDETDEDNAEDEAFELSFASHGEEGYQMVRQAVNDGAPYAVLFVDMRMPPGWDGLETLRRIWEIDTQCRTVICTAYSDYTWEEILATVPAGAPEPVLLNKPFCPGDVQDLTSALIRKWGEGSPHDP